MYTIFSCNTVNYFYMYNVPTGTYTAVMTRGQKSRSTDTRTHNFRSQILQSFHLRRGRIMRCFVRKFYLHNLIKWLWNFQSVDSPQSKISPILVRVLSLLENIGLISFLGVTLQLLKFRGRKRCHLNQLNMMFT